MVDTVHVQQNMEQNNCKGIDDFYLASSNGRIAVTGSLSILEAVELIKTKILLKEATVKLAWLPPTAPPDMTSPLTILFRQPDKLKRLSSSYMKWLLKPMGLKMVEVSICDF